MRSRYWYLKCCTYVCVPMEKRVSFGKYTGLLIALNLSFLKAFIKPEMRYLINRDPPIHSSR